jgi:hypothetical protein
MRVPDTPIVPGASRGLTHRTHASTTSATRAWRARLT